MSEVSTEEIDEVAFAQSVADATKLLLDDPLSDSTKRRQDRLLLSSSLTILLSFGIVTLKEFKEGGLSITFAKSGSALVYFSALATIFFLATYCASYFKDVGRNRATKIPFRLRIAKLHEQSEVRLRNAKNNSESALQRLFEEIEKIKFEISNLQKRKASIEVDFLKYDNQGVPRPPSLMDEYVNIGGRILELSGKTSGPFDLLDSASEEAQSAKNQINIIFQSVEHTEISTRIGLWVELFLPTLLGIFATISAIATGIR